MTPSAFYHELASLLSYDPLTGIFRWVESHDNHVKAGDTAGAIGTQGYRKIGLRRRYIAANRLAFFMVYGRLPVGVIDHINGDKQDDRIENLRECTVLQNAQNSKVPRNNTSGFPGVSWYRRNACWMAQIGVNFVTHHLGYFDRPEDAYAAYRQAKERFHPFAPDGCDLPPIPVGADASRRRTKERFLLNPNAPVREDA